MKLVKFKAQFFKRLAPNFPQSEITAFFKILIQKYLGIQPVDLVLNPDKNIKIKELELLLAARERLFNNEPLQYIIGETEFYGYNFTVTPDVLIPRPETEELVEWILLDLKDNETSQLKILDIGTGSGCIAVSLAINTDAKITALDVSDKALQLAEHNAELNKVTVQFVKSNILEMAELPQKYTVIVSNPPYVRNLEKAEMHQNVLRHEPDLALFVDDDNPLIFYKKISELAYESLEVDGVLYFEINQYLGDETVNLVKEAGFKTVELRNDFAGKPRMIKAKR
ncbi:peptide chain release factor N(5)-glutamine methyltransferase [Leeuwenhoekiella sp. MAR_2009_132]|uniref:peptide chain release factor N(5)-glutamine methyltransferase n=1 Tax=Leeuwenhoekiella sp. MAR_2009_132 TaxID=1392489 RepID=UPI00048CA558|nr:peptide chain release factor N(5)-glutamine methyltransferase [Leeuwenhoekiella sp. MAR_2009_132]